ncbi:pyridine nucleotide-disulfide oxidoreductase [Sorangium cellulosum]|uniref:Pyridine nucleotide-disulfide oxidoreductase n=1 Tax=Sorangium cellulosum TaxID=56 RepID=A0A2L0F1C3_SORCE|nr:FAD-dependent oxidoreductase [Sorangium cellulosum]AUX45333.1 pyridine nucleotide-disulfide oxidoreductase [Sorangium cellulosum]
MDERAGSKQEARGRARVVVIGGGYAGVLAALRIVGKAARRRVPVAVALVNPSPQFVERIRLHELAAGRRQRRLELFRLLGAQVELVIGRVRTIDAAARAVEVELADGGGAAAEGVAAAGIAAADGGAAEAAVTRRLGYDALVYAPGSAADPEVVPGGREHAFTLADAASSRALHARLRAARDGDRVVVVGGGLTAIEAAAEIAEAFPALRVALAARGGVGEGLSERGRAYLGRALGELGVAVRTGVRAVRVDAGGLLVARGEAGDGAFERDAAERVAADIVVLAAGFRPAALAASSGLATVAGGRLVVDRWLRAPAHPEIWGVGDAAAALDGEGAPLRMGCATALPQATYAAEGIVAALAGDPQPPPFRFVFLFQCISLGRRRGLIQRVDPRDRPLERVLTGRPGAWAKELVCRFTVASLRVERLLSGTSSGPGKEPRRQGAADAAGAADYRRLPSGAAT